MGSLGALMLQSSLVPKQRVIQDGQVVDVILNKVMGVRHRPAAVGQYSNSGSR